MDKTLLPGQNKSENWGPLGLNPPTEQVKNWRKSQKKASELIQEFLGGAFGESSFDAPPGSVLDPNYQARAKARDAGYVFQQATGLAPIAGIAGRGALAAPELVSGGKAAQRGAVRIGGDPLTVATHATSEDPVTLRSIAEEGLFAPSIGLSRNSGNAYAAAQPTFVFRAGALDRHFPDEAPPGIFRQDAYVWNPSRLSAKYDQTSVAKQWEKFQPDLSAVDGKTIADLLEDTRLTQMMPDKGAQSAAIVAGPRFRNLKEWEEHPLGARSIVPGAAHKEAVRNYQSDYSRWIFEHEDYSLGKAPISQLRDLAKFAKEGRDPALHAGDPVADLYSLARNAPTEMGEMKIYAPSVPAGPNEATLYMPTTNTLYKRAAEDLGYSVYGPEELAGLAGDLEVLKKSHKEMPLHLLAPETGLAPPPPAKAREMFEALRAQKYSSPGMEAQKEMDDALGGINEALKNIGVLDEASELPQSSFAELSASVEDALKVAYKQTGDADLAKEAVKNYLDFNGVPSEFSDEMLESFDFDEIISSAMKGLEVKEIKDTQSLEELGKLFDQGQGMPSGLSLKTPKFSPPPLTTSQQQAQMELMASSNPPQTINKFFEADPTLGVEKTLESAFGIPKEDAAAIYNTWVTDVNSMLSDLVMEYLLK